MRTSVVRPDGGCYRKFRCGDFMSSYGLAGAHRTCLAGHPAEHACGALRTWADQIAVFRVPGLPRSNRGIAIGVHFLAKTKGEGHGNGPKNEKKKAIAEIEMTAKKQPATEAGGSEAPHHSTDRECHGGGGAGPERAILPRRRWTTS
jgi:hypothetical protein